MYFSGNFELQFSPHSLLLGKFVKVAAWNKFFIFLWKSSYLRRICNLRRSSKKFWINEDSSYSSSVHFLRIRLRSIFNLRCNTGANQPHSPITINCLKNPFSIYALSSLRYLFPIICSSSTQSKRPRSLSSKDAFTEDTTLPPHILANLWNGTVPSLSITCTKDFKIGKTKTMVYKLRRQNPRGKSIFTHKLLLLF